MHLYERETHEARLRHLTGEALAGRGRVLLIEGVAASGRTALLRGAVEGAERAGLRALRAACSPLERELAGSMLSQLLHSLPVPDELAEQPVPDYHEFCRWILKTAARTPLVVAVDDLQHADPESARGLLYLARRLGAAPVLLVATWRRDEDQVVSPFIAELLGDPRAERLRVAPLSAAGTARLVRDRLADPAAGPGLAEELHRIGGGSPLLLDALVEDARQGGPEPVTEQGYGAAVVDLLRRWDPELLPVARVLAVLGEHATPERIARLTGLEAESGTRAVERELSRMTAAGVLRDGRFPHPAAQRAVAATLSGPERSALHRRAASLLHALGESAPAVAHHLAESRQRMEPWAVAVLTEAAEAELLAGRYERAVRFFELAGDASTGPAERAAALERLADAEWRLSPSAVLRHLDPLVAAARAGRLATDRLPGLIRQLLWHGRDEDADAVLARLRAAAPEDPAAEADARALESWLAFTHPRLARQGASPFPRAAGDGPAAVRGPAGASGGDPWLAVAAALCELFLSGRTAERADWVEHCLRDLRAHGNPAWAEESAALALWGLLDADLPEVVLDRCAALVGQDARPEPTRRAVFGALRAEALLRRGDLSGALHGAQEALTLLPAHAWGVAVGLPLSTLTLAAARSGEFAVAERHQAFSPPETMFGTRYGLSYLHARGRYHLAAQRSYAALSDFAACGDLARSLGLDTAALVPWRTGAAEAWLQLGNEERARRLVREQLTRSDAAGRSGRGRALRMLAAVSAPERRPHLLLEAVELFEECGDAYEQARVLADLGRAHSALGDSSRARTTLRRARHLALSCAAVPLCDELLAMTEPAAPEPRPADARQLTESERRVAHLAVLGYTNREIAAKLYVTSSTVEQHLTRVYRKLDVKRRKDLPADLGTAPLRRRSRRVQPASVRRPAS
ncbi:AAA family ATPase [Streptomyces sp. NPDC048106]|uniref:helix-turn-helix transcriptional regulator n=1 Tax=Streptomyces sp. NPDC048106 TaxID=3155750 RepID=UPI0034566791